MTSLDGLATRPEAALIAAHCRIAGEAVRDALLCDGSAMAIIEPGDSTRYEILVTKPGVHCTRATVDYQVEVAPTSVWVVSLVNMGRTASWSGDFIDRYMAAELWGAGNLHTGMVLAEFLSAVIS